jgi:hypothetical protein
VFEQKQKRWVGGISDRLKEGELELIAQRIGNRVTKQKNRGALWKETLRERERGRGICNKVSSVRGGHIP